MNRDRVAALLLAVGITAIIIDIILYNDGVPNNTWSEVLYYWGQHLVAVPIALGGLPGHFWARTRIPWGLRGSTGVATVVIYSLTLIGLSFMMPINPWDVALGSFFVFSLAWRV